MKPLLDFLAVHGAMLVVGVSVLLGLASLLVVVQRQPIHRQRIAEASMVLCVIWLILACVPLPRFTVDRKKPAPVRTLELYEPQAGDEVIAAEVFKVPNQAPMPKRSTGIGVPLPMPPQSTTDARRPQALRRNWGMIWAGVYASGVGVCVFYSVLGHVLLCRLLRGSRAFDFAADSSVRVRICDDYDRPISFGLLWPTILLPARFTELDRVKQQHILRHELAHISQRDAFGHFLFNLLFPVLYFHPLYWVLRRKTNLARELIADDVAAAYSSRESYVADLLALARERLGSAALSTHALGLFQSKTDLYRRMHMLMQTNRPLERRCSIYWRVSYSTLLVVALVLASGTLGLRRANAQAAVAEQIAVDKKNVEERAVADQRQAELDKLRAEQDQIRAKLDMLEAEKQKLQAELEQRRANGQAENGAAAYKRAIAQRQQAMEQAKRAQDWTVFEKIAEQNDKAADEAEKAGKNEWKAQLNGWMAKKNPGAANREQNEFPGRAQLDLVSLANSYVDAIGNLKLAQLELDELVATRGPEHKDVTRLGPAAKVKIEIAQRKVNIFRGIAEVALESAKSDLEIATQQVQNGLAPKSSITEAQSRLKILEVILAQ